MESERDQTEPADGGREGVIEVMARLVAGEQGAMWDLHVLLEMPVRRMLRAEARRVDLHVGDDDLLDLTLDTAVAVAKLAPAWDPAGALPWVWARKPAPSPTCCTTTSASSPATLDDEHLDLLEPPAAVPMPEPREVLRVAAQRHPGARGAGRRGWSRRYRRATPTSGSASSSRRAPATAPRRSPWRRRPACGPTPSARSASTSTSASNRSPDPPAVLLGGLCSDRDRPGTTRATPPLRRSPTGRLLMVVLAIVGLAASACRSGGTSASELERSLTPETEAVPTTAASSEPASGTDVEVIDGDTLEVRSPDGTVERVRVIGINAPESDECFAGPADEAMRRLVGDGPVEPIRDRSDRDQYGRLLRYVHATAPTSGSRSWPVATPSCG